MNWQDWTQHFERNRTRPLPLLTPDLALPPAATQALACSLARFQVGEAGEGRIVHQIARAQLAGIDGRYHRALAAFVAEEGRHARILAQAVRLLGGRLLASTWSERLFVFGRRLCGVRLKLLVLLAAEVIGIGFYGLLASRLPAGSLRRALAQVCNDERAHLTFHQDFFRTQAPRGWRRAIFVTAWWLIAPAALLVVLLDHRATLRHLGVSLPEAASMLADLVHQAGALDGQRDRPATAACAVQSC
jgi:hypothetical protein